MKNEEDDGCRAGQGLSRWERAGLLALLVVVVLFGLLVEMRTAFLSRRMGDLNCYLRPAWAVRTGADIYQILDDSGWHYNYPPLLAILLTPLADAPAGAERTGLLPYAVSAALWYVLGVICLALGVHRLAGALETTSLGRESAGSRRWWTLRLVPLLACVVPIGHSLMRGQINPFVVLCFCATLAALVRGRSGRAGWWLAWPICIKVYPVYLLLYPLVQRDRRFLLGCAAGLLVGLVAVPLAAFGPQRMLDYYVEYYQVTLAPGLGIGTDLSRSDELTYVTSTDSQSLLATLHNTLHLDRTTRPRDAGPVLRRISYVLGGILTAATLWAGGWQRRLQGPDILLYFGALVLIMLLLCPVCHLHYFSMAVPLVMGLLAASWKRGAAPRLGWGLASVLLVNVVVNALPNLPALEVLRDLGATMYMGLLLWGLAVIRLWRRARDVRLSTSNLPEPEVLAA